MTNNKLYEVLPDGRWAFSFDHHMISTFTDCEAAFELKFMQRKRARGGVSFATACGQWWAKSLEWYYTALNSSFNQATAVDLALHAWDDCLMKSYTDDKAERFGGKAGAVSMMSQYYDYSYGVDFVNWHVIAVEAGFGRKHEVCIGENDKVVVYYVGRPDLVVVEDRRIKPVDHKTKDYIRSDIHSQFKPHPQTAGYIVAAQTIAKQLGYDGVVDRCIINVAARLEPSDRPKDGKRKPRFTRVLTHYAPAELEEWRRQTVAKATRLRYCIENNEWIWNSPSACHRYGGCEYRPIHSVPPDARPIVIQSQYMDSEPWVPYEVEE